MTDRSGVGWGTPGNAERLHPWDLAPPEAVALQRELATRVIKTTTFDDVAWVGGVDASYRKGIARAAIVVLRYPDLALLDYEVAERPIDYPYVPGLLSFREAPPVLKAFEGLRRRPDLLIFDAQGLAHPRRFGLASHVGLLLDIPSIGCAKSKLCGEYDPPAPERGSFTYLYDEGDIIGAVVRTRAKVKPVFVSIGHRVDLSTAIDYVLGCGGGYKLPEPTRWAHKIAGGARPPLSSGPG